MDYNKSIPTKHLNQLQSAFEIDLQGDLNKYLGIKVGRHADGSIHLSQLQLIDRILVDLKFLRKDEK
jgi:hypothetical protein